MPTPLAAILLETSESDENLATSLNYSGITAALEQANVTTVTPLSSCSQELSSLNKIPSKRVATEYFNSVTSTSYQK